MTAAVPVGDESFLHGLSTTNHLDREPNREGEKTTKLDQWLATRERKAQPSETGNGAQ